MPFLDRLQHWAALQPDANAVTIGADRLSYAELQVRSSRRARELAGESSGGPTVLCLPNGLDFVVDFVAAVAGVGTVAVLDPDWPALQRTAIERMLREAGSTPLPASSSRAPTTPPAPAGLRDGPADSVFLYGFTSGTTALPKAFTRGRDSWQRAFAASSALFDLRADDRVLAPGPLSASLTLYALAETLYAGAAFHTLPHFDVGDALDSVAHAGVTRIVAVPTALRMLAERGLIAGVDGGALTAIVSAGARLDAATLASVRNWAPRATVFDYYGAAELSFVTARRLRPGEDRTESPTAVGRPFPGVDVRVLDDAGRASAPGATGTIVVRSRLVSAGYAWGDDGTAFARVAADQTGEWCTVGDQGHLDDAGELHFEGRRADMIVTSGHNVYPQEVEATLLTGLGGSAAGGAGAQVVVTGLADARRGTLLVAALLEAPDPGAGAFTLADLRTAATGLAPPKRPRAYYRITDLPVTRAGKVSRRLLADWITEGDPRVERLD
ncbi:MULTISPECIES: class I adenylate-forming enzyme family protein [Cryobacterium]|uniref:class I adenylate-forming enzyme family protein n=2 Tax=Microbacteriaceae TaxID=85023 RepID=UPI001F543653|nr:MULTISPECIES: AMP-binding protein [Cryobacterium]MEB0288476.1 AMP-binding protein [Cryobacterium sp. 10S3]WPX15422.1 AMP-binding protein [Cryobacterium sp. 10S3]